VIPLKKNNNIKRVLSAAVLAEYRLSETIHHATLLPEPDDSYVYTVSQ